MAFVIPASSLQLILEGDKAEHRKKRRNRTRASCLNCYASKRKCDKKRPCTRCVRLGTTGLCVYEIEDPTPRDDAQIEEINRLRRRIGELESIIRQLKNKPHPRWTTTGGVAQVFNHECPCRREELQTNATMQQLSLDNTDTDVVSDLVDVHVKKETADPKNSYSNGRPQAASTSPLDLQNSSASVQNDTEVTSRARDPEHPGPPVFASDCDSCQGDSSTFIHDAGSSRDNPWPCIFIPGSNFCPIPASPKLHPQFSFFHQPQSSYMKRMICNCLKDPIAFGPLVHLGIALRSSCEVLERLHPPSSNCVLFCRVASLEQLIFSVSPYDSEPGQVIPNVKSSLGHDLALADSTSPVCGYLQSTCSSEQELGTSDLPSYSSVPSSSQTLQHGPQHHDIRPQPPHSPGPFSYLMDNTVYVPLRNGRC